MPEARPAVVAFEGVNPILRVEDINAAVDHYARVLGFKLDWRAPGSFRSVSRGSCHLFLCQGDQGHPGSWVWIGVEDADALLEEYRQTGAKIRHANELSLGLRNAGRRYRRQCAAPRVCAKGKRPAPANGWTGMAGAGFPCPRAAINA